MVPWEVFSGILSPILILTIFFSRYRSTATLIVLILADGPYSPHKILNNFVKRSTDFLPTDGDEWCDNEPDVDNLYMKKVKGWSFERLSV
jgi:hypothetical protein